MTNQRTITIYRDPNTGLLFYNRSWDNASFQLPIVQNDVLKIHEDFSYYKNLLKDYEIIPIKTTDGIPTFIFRTQSQKVYVAGGGGGGGGSKGITVQEEGVQVNGTIQTLNFTGAGVTVTDQTGGKVQVNIPGYVIQALTTTERLALHPTTPMIVEDITLDEYFKWSTITNSWIPF